MQANHPTATLPLTQNQLAIRLDESLSANETADSIGGYFDCFVIGQGSLLLQCVQILEKEGHGVLGIISDDENVGESALQFQVPCHATTDDLVAILSSRPFDYLFSINNESILPEQVLALPKRLAINYHDAPLPKYAGVYATTWALLNGEKEHGITWHVMSGKVDSGDILEQCCFAIEPGETVFTLNGKCFEAAIGGFKNMVGNLASGSLQPRRQDLTKRSFFPSHKRPPQGAILQWSQSAEEMDALVRALNFAAFPNPLCSPKLALGGWLYVIHELTVESTCSKVAPGALVSLSNDCLTIATATHDVSIKSLSTMDGNPVPLPEIIARHGLQAGQVLADVEADSGSRIDLLNRQFAKHEPFWRERLATTQQIDFPYLLPSMPNRQAGSVKTILLSLPDEAHSFFNKHGFSAEQALVALFLAYLNRLCGEEPFDVAFTPAKHPGTLHGAEHFFASELPLWVDFNLESTFEKACFDLQEQLQLIDQQEGYAQDLVARTPALSACRPILQSISTSIAIREVTDFNETGLPGNAALTLLVKSAGTLKDMADFQGKDWGMLVFNPDRVEPGSVERIANHLLTMLAGIIADPELPIDKLPLLTEAERHLLLHTFNDTEADYPKDKTISQLFEEQAERTPGNVALVFQDKQLTYKELNEAANRVAHHLRDNFHVQPDDVIALQLECSEWMIIAILGVLKSGAAYLPIAPDAPKARVEFMLRDSGAKALLTSCRESEGVTSSYPLTWVPVLAVENLQTGRTDNPAVINRSQDLAYIIYTSGSTGQPKGVMIEHRGVVNMVCHQRQEFEISPADKVLQFADYTFDTSVSEIWVSLTAGAALVMATKETLLSPDLFAGLLQWEQVTVTDLPPAFLATLDENILATVRLLITGGEAIHPATMHKYSANRQYINGYGPTEATVTACTFKVPSSGNGFGNTVPIGRPIANVQVVILGKNLELLPPGIPGELCIGGAGLARGYLNNPELTAQKFIEHPFHPDSPDRGRGDGERLYRTGDLARWLPDGNIEFLGRLDHQLKIRGYRIEAGEIEQALLAHPALLSCVVTGHVPIAIGIEAGKELVAYLVPKQDAVLPGVSELRAFLAQTLPEHMLPSHFVEMSSLPLNSSGKVNRKALPAPPDNYRDSALANGTAYSPPRNLVEQQLADIWQQVLVREKIGIHDNFFHLGGHSLKAIQLAARISQAFDIRFPIATIFQHPRLADWAAHLQQLSPFALPAGMALSAGAPPFLFAFPPALGLGIFFQPLAHLLESQPVYAFDFLPEDDRLERYFREIKTQQPDGPYHLSGYSAGGYLAFELARYLESKGETVSELILLDSGAPTGEFRKTEEKLQANAQDVVDYILASPHMADLKLLLQDESSRRQVMQLMLDFYRYCNELAIEGKIAANIRLLHPGKLPDVADFRQLWGNFTTGNFTLHRCEGEHMDMFLPPQLETNAALLDDLLRQIFQQKETPATVGAENGFRHLPGVSPEEESERKKMQTSLPLTQNQLAIWLDEILFERSSMYNIGAYYAIRGGFQPEAFRQALRRVIAESDAFGIHIPISYNGHPVQVIQPQLSYEAPLLDFSNEADPEVACIGWMQERFKPPFDLAAPPLFEFALLKAGEGSFFWFLKMHHLIVDGWGVSVFTAKVVECYNELLGVTPEKRLPVFPFGEYIEDELAYYGSEQFEKDKSYWLDKFQALPLPVREARDAQAAKKGLLPASKTKWLIERALYGRIEAFAQAQNVSVFHFWLGILATYFHRTTGNDRLCIGVPVLNRSSRKFKSTIGLFTGVSPLLIETEQEMSFGQLLHQIKATLRQDYRSQRFPVQELLRSLNHLTLGERELHEIFFSYEAQNYELLLAETQTHLTFLTGEQRKIPMNIFLRDYSKDEPVEMDFDFLAAYFPAWEVERMMNRIKVLVEQVLKQPEERIRRLEILPEAEKHLLLYTFNDTAADYPHDKTIVQLFEEQVERTPENIALVFEERQISYRELNERANRLAHRLREDFHVQPDDVIALQLERSEWLVIAILGVLKAGAAYLPLATDSPKIRTQFMLHDSGAKALLADEATLPKARELEEILPVLQVEKTAHENANNPAILHSPKAGSLAYIIYTSGSTGQPKGVMIEHRALSNFLSGMQKQPGIHAGDTLLASTTYTFDISILELLLPLVCGAKVLLVNSQAGKDTFELQRILRRKRPTILQATPALWQLLLQSGWEGDPNLKAICGGEALSEQLAAQLLSRCGEVWNMYGPTETTIWSSLVKVKKGFDCISIGSGIQNTRLFILNENLACQPIGIAGELLIGGEGLSRGYLNNPELTQEKFVPHPFPEYSGQRLYRTGDLARWLPEGNIEFLGRLDHQLKIRGYRIEAGEIEQTLMSHPAIQNAVVVADKSEGAEELTAYFVAEVSKLGNAELAEAQAAQVANWQDVWESTHTGEDEATDPAFDLAGWRESYTRAEIPPAEMKEWVDNTVRRILALQPAAVLEIGVGTGLLLARIAPSTSRYFGIDIMDDVAAHFARLQAWHPELAHAQVSRQAAHDLSGIPAGAFDTLVVNSVAQYFPDQAYLEQVLAQAAGLLRSGGKIYAGDIRSLPLLSAFHTSVQLFLASDETPRFEFGKAVHNALAAEKELAIDPLFFYFLAEKLGGWASIELKNNTCLNEMTCFRYDVSIRLGEAAETILPNWQDWSEAGWSIERLKQWLTREGGGILGLKNIPNSRLDREMKALDWLNNESPLATVGAMKERLPDGEGFDPNLFWQLAENSPYSVQVNWSAATETGAFDVAFVPRRKMKHGLHLVFPIETEAKKRAHASVFTNQPIKNNLNRQLLEQIKMLLQERLPHYMMPQYFVALDAMPLTPSGKIDRKALPNPRTQLASNQEYVAPRNPVEATLARLWAEVLKTGQVGIHDNFFHLGGHSLRVIRMVELIRKQLSVELNINEAYSHPTITGLAEIIYREQNIGMLEKMAFTPEIESEIMEEIIL